MNFNFGSSNFPPQGRRSRASGDRRLYDILGVAQTATVDEINRAYRKLALECHPDRNKSPEAEEKFKEITKAKEILTDGKRRKIYDEYGEEAVTQGGGNDDVNFFPGGAAFFNMNMNMNPMGRPKRYSQKKYRLTLEEYFTKKSVEIKITRNVNCRECQGTGFQDKLHRWCKICRGTGHIQTTIPQGMMMRLQEIGCPTCHGAKIDTTCSTPKCPKCQGATTIEVTETFDVEIPKRIVENNRVIIEKAGSVSNGEAEDLAVIFMLDLDQNRYNLSQDGGLVYILDVNLADIVCGFRRLIQHPSGRKIAVCLEQGCVLDPKEIHQLDRLGFDQKPLLLAFRLNFPSSIIMPKKKIMNFENLSSALGGCAHPNLTDSEIDEIDIMDCYNLSAETKYDANRHSRPDMDDDVQNFHAEEGVSCAQQ